MGGSFTKLGVANMSEGAAVPGKVALETMGGIFIVRSSGKRQG